MMRLNAMSRRISIYGITLVCSVYIIILINGSSNDVAVKNIIDVDNDVVNDQRLLITEEMRGYRYPSGRFNITARSLSELTPETGGRPVRNIIITTWRSGSTFLAEIVNSHPANYYHYEPLGYFEYVQIRGKPLATSALKTLRNLMECDYSNMDRYLQFGIDSNRLFQRNTRLWEQCQLHPNLCWQPDFLNPFCRLFPFQSMKVVRLRLNLVEELLEDPSLNVRVVYLVRDPRGTLHSRQRHRWCQGSPDCIDPERLCMELQSDHSAAVSLSAKYPYTFRAIRYEDLSLEPFTRVQELFKFLGLDFHESVQKFLETHTKVNAGDSFSTYRNTKSTPYHWRQNLDNAEVQTIQRSCAPAMDLWGYIKTFNSTHQKEFNPLGDFEL